jgi:hypothetical protein
MFLCASHPTLAWVWLAGHRLTECLMKMCTIGSTIWILHADQGRALAAPQGCFTTERGDRVRDDALRSEDRSLCSRSHHLAMSIWCDADLRVIKGSWWKMAIKVSVGWRLDQSMRKAPPRKAERTHEGKCLWAGGHAEAPH